MFLPVITGQPTLAAKKKCDTPIVRGGHETILLVEDKKPLRTLTRAVLEHRGYRVIEAASGVDALAKWEQCGSQVDLLLTAMVMPDGLTGRELAKSLQVSNPDVKVVYTSGYAMNLDATSFKFRDGLNFLPKPYHPLHLYKAVRECLDQKP